MVALYGKEMSRRDVAMHAGTLSQFAGVRLLTLGDGVERGVRLLEFRTGTGLRFCVMLDRGMDLGECDYRGMAIGWQSPSSFRHPSLHDPSDEGGLAWLRSFSGLLSTCGLDHILGPQSEDAAHYNYPFRKTVQHGIHGRVALVPARLTGYGEAWDGEECTLWCEGVMQQSTVFGENLHLIRRIEARVGGNEIVLRDRVVNRGFSRTPHMLLYHIDIGYPVLAEGSRYLAPILHSPFAAHAATYRDQGVGYRTMAAPRERYVEQVWEHWMAADAQGHVPVALVNDALGLGLLVETNKAELPCQYEWQNLQAGLYTLGIEPVTNHIRGKDFAKERDELIWLEHDEERRYTTRFAVLDGADAIAAAERRIAAIAAPQTDEFPELTGRWDKLPGR
jgi:hypothetical protein